MKIVFSILTACIFMASASAATAGDYKPPKLPDAPPEFQKMKNPFKPSQKKIVKEGEKIYKRKCKKCHGMKGDGKGSSAEDLEYEPTAFSKPGYLKKRSDGQLFWITMHGSKGTDMEAFGPGTDVNLSEKDIWKIITFMRKKFQK